MNRVYGSISVYLATIDPAETLSLLINRRFNHTEILALAVLLSHIVYTGGGTVDFGVVGGNTCGTSHREVVKG